MDSCRIVRQLPGSSARRAATSPGCGSLAPGATLLRDADDQIGEIVTKPRRGLAVFSAAWRLSPVASLRGRSSQDLVELRVNVAIRVPVVMRPDEHDARPAWGLECDDDPERSAQVLDAHSTDRRRAGEPVAERRAAVAREVIEEGTENRRVLPVRTTRLLLRAPRGDYLHCHT